MPDLQTSTLVLFNVVALLLPTGLALLAVGAAEEKSSVRVASTALIALAATAVGYYVCGFAFQFGGAAFVSKLPGLAQLAAEWSPLDTAWGSGWGAIGLRGFLLGGEAYNADAYLLFVAELPAVLTAVLVALLPLSRHMRHLELFGIGLLLSSLVYPLFGNWVRGGGWLANLGLNLGQGHGYVDAGGSGSVFALGAFVALAGQLLLKPVLSDREGPARLPPVHFPLFTLLGALLVPVGLAGSILGNPLLPTQMPTPVALGNLLLSGAASALLALFYSWFVTGQPDSLAASRAFVAGLVAACAACAFVPAWAAMIIGAVAAILLLIGTYLWEQVLRRDDASASLAMIALPSIWGVLAVGLLADGRWGAGWNGVGGREYLGIAGQGVTGLLVQQGLQPAGAVQLQAQLVGLVALLVVALLFPLAVFRAAKWLRRVGSAGQAQPQQGMLPVSDDALVPETGIGEQGDEPSGPASETV